MKNSEDKSLLESVGSLVFIILYAMFGGLYLANIVQYIATWFSVPLVLSTVQWFGVIQIIGLITYKESKSDKEESIWISAITKIVLITTVWGIMWIIHIFIH